MAGRMTRRQALLTGAGFAGAAPSLAWARTQGADAALADQVDAFVRAALAAWPDQPGLGVAVVKDGETLLARGYGVKRKGSPEAVTETTQFAVASNTKAMTAALLAMLVDEGKVAWDAPVKRYLPDFRLSDPVITQLITVRDLLSHRAGFGLGAGDLLFWPNSDRSREQVLAAVPHVPIEHGFRAGYHYCNLMFVQAGAVIEAVTGQRFEDVLKTRILDRLGMGDTVPLCSQASSASAKPHGRVGPPLRYQGEMTVLADSIPAIWNWDSAAAAGGVCTTARDWAQWIKVQLAAGEAPGGPRLWSQAQANEMWKPNIISGSSPGPTAELPGRAIAQTYALGWAVQDYRGERLVTHGGGAPGFISATLMLPGRNTGFSVFSNAEEGLLMRTLRSGIADILMGKAGFDWIADSKRLEREGTARSLTAAAEIDAAQRAGAQPSLPLAAYAGTWRDPWYGDVAITQRDGGLWLSMTQTPALQGPLEPYDGETFRTRFPDRREEDAFVTFELENGRPVRARMRGVSPDIDFSYDYQDLRLTRI
ncbi:serine hydrolase [Brevundimonas sp. 2R-24]|uniref:Serine hydrolase n=1 Tax=Peiella sedimenti TaxID=3061083 RepID=A0ABT8SQF2_9CAUL|nr:serine hydrolase [Caulobacteraceae bacterium XZ-24]